MTENDLKKRIYQLSDLTPTEKLTLLVCLTFVDWSSWAGSASINQIAHALSAHRRAISRALRGLSDKGYIERTSKRLGRQMNTRSDLRLNVDMITGGDNQSHLGGDDQSHSSGDIVSLGGDIVSLGGDDQSHLGGDIVSLGGDDQSHLGGDIMSLGGDIKSPLYIQPNNQPDNQPNIQPDNQPNNQQHSLKGQTANSSLSNFEKRRQNEQALNRMHALMWRQSAPDIGRSASRFAFRAVVESYLEQRDIEPKDFNPSDYATFWDENKTQLIERMQSS